MADVKPIKITIEGVEKVLKSTQQIQNEIKEVQKLYKQKNNIELSDKEALAVLRNLKKEATETEKSLESIDKNVKFASFKAAAKSISTELVNLAATAVNSGKSTSENITDIGNSIAGVAANFGFVGIAASALITVLTPVISSLFDVSESQKALNEEVKEGEKASESLGSEIGKEIVSLLNLTSVIKSNTTTSKEKTEALKTLNEEYKPYLENLGVATVTTSNLESVTIALTKAIISNAVAASARVELEKSVGAVVAKNLDIAKVKNRQDKIALDILKISNVAIDRNKILSAEQRNLILQNTIALNRNVSEVSELVDSYTNLETQLLLTKGNLVIVTDEAKETADAFTDLDKSVDLTNIIGWVEKLNGKINTISPNISNSVTKSVSNIEVFGESVEDLIKLLETGDLSSEDTEIALNSLIKAANEYSKTLDNVSDKVLKASDNIKTLNDENTELFKNRARLEAEFQKSGALTNTTQLEQQVALNKKLLKELEDDFEKAAGSMDIKLVEDFEKKYGIVLSNDGFTDLQEQRQAAIKKSEKALKVASEQEIILKQTTATKILEIDEKLKSNKEKIIQNQRLIDVKGAEQSVKIYQDNQKRIEDIQKKIAEDSQKAFENAIAAEIAARDSAGKAQIAANLANLTTYTDLIVQNTQQSISAVRKSIEPTLESFNKEFTGAFTVDDDIIVANQKVVDEVFSKGTQEQIQRFLVVQSAANSANKEIRALNAKSRADINNAQLNFAETYIQNYKTLNETEVRFIKVKNEEVLANSEARLKQETENIKNNVKERRELGKEQSDDELRTILQSNRFAIELNENKYDALLELQFLEGGKAVDELKRQGIDTELLERENALKVESILRQKYKTEEELQKFYNELLDKNQKKQNKKTQKNLTKDFTSIVKELQTFGNLLVDILNQNNQNIIDALNEDLDFLERRTTDVLNTISNLEDDLEGKRSGRRDAVLQSLEQQKQIEKDLALEKIRLAKQVEAEEIKLRKRQQAAAITNAVINGALAVTNILAQPSIIPEPANSIFKGVQIGISAATTAAQIALIASQKFAKGGFTGSGTNVDETGHKVAGVVHNDEWVAPKWMVESPKFSGVINQLENARTKGFADGGFTSPNFNSLSNSVNPNNNAKLESMLQNYTNAAIALSNRPIYTSVTEIQNVATTSDRRKNQARL